jgi:Flp pilus assembly pilin Flp
MKHRLAIRAPLCGLHRWRDDRGAAAVEFGLLLPVLTLLVFGTIEFGRAWNVRQTLTDAAREGARVAAVNNGIMAQATLDPLVRETIRQAAARAGLETASPPLMINLVGIAGGANLPATVAIEYRYTPLFGTWFFQTTTVPIRTRTVMRNE